MNDSRYIQRPKRRPEPVYEPDDSVEVYTNINGSQCVLRIYKDMEHSYCIEEIISPEHMLELAKQLRYYVFNEDRSPYSTDICDVFRSSELEEFAIVFKDIHKDEESGEMSLVPRRKLYVDIEQMKSLLFKLEKLHKQER